MIIKTKCFGQVDIEEEKIITFEHGLFGFEDCKKFTILFNNEKAEKTRIHWLQSMDEPALAFPMINPLIVNAEYNPNVDDDAIAELDDLTEDNIAMFLIITVPGDITKMSANLKAPIIINSDSRKGAQVVVNNQDYSVKYGVYEILTNKEGSTC
ncbi:MAG: flagellar assembly protein FliW [bacterium]|nr:flagellar assembly protein FliW [bacterium]